MIEIERLQKNLTLLRHTANWSVQEFADMLGVTRQTINNLEKVNQPTKMSKIQYLAIRSCFSYEIEHNDNQVLKHLLYCIVDHPENITDEDRKLISQQAKIISSAIKGGSSNKEVNEYWMHMLAMAGATILPIVIEASLPWIESIMKKNRK